MRLNSVKRFKRYLRFIAVTGIALRVRSMKRRQFNAMLATLSLGGLSSAAAEVSAQQTAPLEVEDATVEFGGVTASISEATFEYRDGAMRLQLLDWTMDSSSSSLAIGEAHVTVDEVDAETFSAVRSAMVETYEGRTVSPMLTVLSDGTIDESAPVRVFAGPVRMDGQTAADEVSATGTVGGVVPEGTRQLAEEGVSLEGVAELGSSEWSRLTVQRDDSQLMLNDVVMQREGAALSISAPSGTAELPDQTLDLTEVSMDVQPPETIPEEHVAFASQVRQSSAEGSLSRSAVESAAADSGVTAENTSEAVRNSRFVLSLGEVTEDGESLVSNFRTSGTLGELMQVVQMRL
jgi:hypothetical protein